MTRRRMTRRRFLRGAGGVAVGLPFLNMGLFGTDAFGKSGTPHPKRFVVLLHPNGVIPSTWFPKSVTSETDFELSKTHKPLEAFRDKLLLLGNVDMKVGGYGPGGMHQQGMGGVLTGRELNSGDFRGNAGLRAGWASGVSIDQYLAQKTDAGTPFASLELGVRANHHAGSEVMTRISYAGSNQPLPPEDDPVRVWDLLFSDHSTEPGATTEVRRRRTSVLDAVRAQLTTIQSKAGYQDRMRLEHHFETMRELERRLNVLPNDMGSACMMPAEPTPHDVDSELFMPQIMKNQMDLLVLALACDMTRVATFQVSNAWNKITFPWLDSNVGGHTLSHAGSSNAAYNEQWTRRNIWYAEQLAYFLGKLDSIQEGEGTMLDNTVVLWTSEVARGNTHSWRQMPLLLAGSAGGAFKMGRYVEYGTTRSTNDLFVSILNAFGVKDQSFGDERFCSGPLSGLS